jgi:cellulose synthase/poly-beta-1,6-N-acetylglucosamine synthase-like glycosyltransferase
MESLLAVEYAPSDDRPSVNANGAMGKQQPSVSVIIPHYNDIKNLQYCLLLLSRQTISADEYEIIVADNNSRCGFAAVEEVCGGRARAVRAPVQGAGEARNAGVRASCGRFLAFLDSDCRPSPDWIANGIAALASADMVGGRVDVDIQEVGNPTPVEAFEIVFAFNFKRYIEKEGFSGSGNMFVPRLIFDKVGGFRVGVAEDKDWGQRAVALGFRWKYSPEVQVSHPARRDWEELCQKWRRSIRESYLLMKERPFARLRWILRAWAILPSPMIHMMNVFGSPKLDRFEDRLKAVGILFRIRWWRFIESHKIMLRK